MRNALATLLSGRVSRGRDPDGVKVVADVRPQAVALARARTLHRESTMLRPPTSGGRGESDFHDYDDADIEPKRGKPADELDPQATDRPTTGTPDRDADLPERLGERIENGSSSSISPGEPDVLPDVGPPDTTM